MRPQASTRRWLLPLMAAALLWLQALGLRHQVVHGPVVHGGAEAAAERGHGCRAVSVADADEIMGVNDRAQLADAARILRRRINRELMLSGVTLVDPEQTYIDHGVAIGADSVIHPNCRIGGATVSLAGAVGSWAGGSLALGGLGGLFLVGSSVLWVIRAREREAPGPSEGGQKGGGEAAARTE